VEGEVSSGGLFSLEPKVADAVPRLSADGDEVAFLANGPYLPSGGELGTSNKFSDDLYVANMESGLTRVQATRRLTEIASEKNETLRSGPIDEIAISPEGTKVAFTTQRVVFPLQSLDYVSPPAAVAGEAELYVVDLATNTLTRLTHGIGGEEEPAGQPHEEVKAGVDPYTETQGEGTFAPSFTSNGQTIAFSSTADNLVYGDGNTPETRSSPGGGSDAFLISQVPFTPEPPQQEISKAPPNPPPPGGGWVLYATAEPTGTAVRVSALVPRAGMLRATATAAVRSGHAVVRRQLAAASTTVAGRSSVTLQLVLSSASEHYVTSPGVTADVQVRFSAPGQTTLSDQIPVLLRPVSSHGKRRHGRRRHRRARRRRR